jgi:hypothetical protein
MFDVQGGGGGGNDPDNDDALTSLLDGSSHASVGAPGTSSGDGSSAQRPSATPSLAHVSSVSSGGAQIDETGVGPLDERSVEEGAESVGGTSTSASAVLAISPHLDFGEFLRRQQGWLRVRKSR